MAGGAEPEPVAPPATVVSPPVEVEAGARAGDAEAEPIASAAAVISLPATQGISWPPERVPVAGATALAVAGTAEIGPGPHDTAVVVTTEEALRVPEAALIPPPMQIEIPPPRRVSISGKAITSLIFAVVGLPVIGILTGWFAVGFGVMALHQIRGPGQYRGQGLAIAGIVLGAVDIGIWTLLALAYFIPSLRHGSGVGWAVL